MTSELTRRIAEATDRLNSAEEGLQAAFAELQQLERADKRIISEELRAAFDKLAEAKKHLEAILDASKRLLDSKQ